MYDFFFNFHNRRLGDDLFNHQDQEGTPPSPPGFSFLVNNAGDSLVDNQGNHLGDFD